MTKFEPEKWMEPEFYGHVGEIEKAPRWINNSKMLKGFGKNWERNFHENIKHINSENYACSVFGSYDARSCIVCGAGPSLADSFEHIKNAVQNGWSVISTDRCLTDLKKNGIRPDYVITIDQQIAVRDDHLRMIGDNDRIVCHLFQDPRIIRRMIKKARNVYYFLSPNPFCPLTAKLFHYYPKEILFMNYGSWKNLTT